MKEPRLSEAKKNGYAIFGCIAVECFYAKISAIAGGSISKEAAVMKAATMATMMKAAACGISFLRAEE